MSKFLRTVLTAAALIFVFNALAVTETKAQIISEILKRMTEHSSALKSLKADIKVDEFDSSSNEHEVMNGAARYVPLKQKDALIRIDWIAPIQESIAVVNKNYVIYRPQEGISFLGKIRDGKSTENDGRQRLDLMNLSKLQMKANHDISYVGKEMIGNGTETWHLQLEPRNAQDYKKIELWIDANGMQIQAKITENSNDSTTILLSNLQKNIPVDTREFIFNLPKGVKRING